MASVQFYGKEKAIEAYENANIPACAIFSGRQIIFRYGGNDINEGKELLNDFLEAIEHSNATYTLKVFENTKGGDLRIKEKTECDLSFNFKILEHDMYLQRQNERGGPYISGMGAVVKKMEELEAKIDGINTEEPTEVEEPEEDFNSIIMDYLKNPQKLGTLISNVRSLISGEELKPQQLTVGNHERIVSSTGEVAEPADKMQRLADALDTLEKNDPGIVDHLVKLAEISNTNKTLFKMLIKNLDSL